MGQLIILGLVALVIPATFGTDFNVTQRESYSYQVSLRKDGRHVCGGTVYSKKYVITSAICVNDTKPTQWTVTTGNLNVNKVPTNVTQIINVSKFYIPNNYSNNSLQNNIAILKLSSDLRLDNYTRSVSIAKKWSDRDKVQCVVSGWGSNGTGTINYNGDLHMANVSILAPGQCTNYKAFHSPEMMCAGQVNNHNPCVGDLGGPLLCNNMLYGIVGWRGTCDADNQPGMYTNVTHFADWIIKNEGPATNAAVLLTVGTVILNLFK